MLMAVSGVAAAPRAGSFLVRFAGSAEHFLRAVELTATEVSVPVGIRVVEHRDELLRFSGFVATDPAVVVCVGPTERACAGTATQTQREQQRGRHFDFHELIHH